MKISVVVTVLNEVQTIAVLIQSLLNQTITPDEILIVDGGSTDGTKKVVENYAQNNPAIKLLDKKGNISVGRNYGIESAKNEIIALIDGGCVAHSDWLEKLMEPFRDLSVGVVAGYYEMITTNSLSKAVMPFQGVTPRKFDRSSFMPSARSMALRRSVWEEVGGFNEDLYKAGEDTLFNYEVVKANIKIERVPEALVDWKVPSTLKEISSKFFCYAKGDAEANIWWHPTQKFNTHNLKIVSIYVRYLFLFTLFFVGQTSSFIFSLFISTVVMYLSWSVWKTKEDISDTQARLYVPFIQVLSDFAIMTGFFSGIVSKRLRIAL